MTSAELVAWSVWPIFGLLVVLTATIKRSGLRAYVLLAAAGTFIIYLVLGALYWQSSIAAVTDLYLFMMAFGFAAIGSSLLPLRGGQGSPARSKAKLVVSFAFGAGLVWMSASTLYSDYAEPRLVLEGRVDNVRRSGGLRNAKYLADIGGHTVKATTPVFERLKSGPYVRAEVGRGSNYIFAIEYLTN
jgi:hypothetical protein